MSRLVICLGAAKTIAPASTSTTSFVIPTPASLAKIAPARSPIFLALPDDGDGHF
jgi:hypothetical protein